MNKAYRFRLAAILRLRRAECEQAELALARANQELHALIGRRGIEFDRCTQMSEGRASFDGTSFAAHQAATALVAAGVRELDSAINVKAAESALARLTWSAARQRLNALERLEERGREEWLAEVLRHEANELDEIAIAAYVREQQVPEGALG